MLWRTKAAKTAPETPQGRSGDGEPYRRAAEPVLAFAEVLATKTGTSAAELLNGSVSLLDRFSAEMERARVRSTTIRPARLALALILDQKARSNRAIDMRVWAAGALRHLFDGRDMTPDALNEFIRRAEDAGADFEAVRWFLVDCAARLAGQRQRFDRSTGPNWTGIVAVLATAFVGAVLGWAGFVEWRYHRDLNRVFAAEALAIGLDREGALPDLAQRLAKLAAARDQVAVQADKAPIRLFAPLFGYDATARANIVYQDAVRRHLPAAIAHAIDDAIASEGDPVVLYDTLRAWSVLSGQSDFAPDYLAGWLMDHGTGDRLLAGLAPHVAALAPPFAALPEPDPELMAQARGFAAEAPEPERAFLELLRGPGAAALTDWVADDRVADLSKVLQRRSGQPINDPVPGLFTAEGWTYARDFGAGIAVQTARSEAARLFDTPLESHNDTPDRVMARLQKETLARWKALITDLRVRPFTDPEAAVFVSGRLAAADTPLVALLREVWNQSGGNDRLRSQAMQLSVATEFGPMIQYVEQGRMTEIAGLFASLNGALGAMDRDAETGLQRLMSVQDRANSIATLRQAPAVVVQIVEDALAQTAAAHADMLTNPLTRAWQAEVLPLCKDAVEGKFPFVEGGPDADLQTLARLLAPGGSLERFYHARAEPYLDTTGPEWRWKPEARFSGLAPETAEFFHAARALSAGLFSADGRLGAELTLAALAEKGKAFVTVGGQGGPVETTADTLKLVWPGAEPEAGVEVSFQTPDGSARLKEPGAWGLLHLLMPLRLRERDDGQRFLVDLRAGAARLFVEITFGAPDNPLARRGTLKGFACPPVL